MNKEFTDLLEVSKKKANKWLDSDIDSKSKNEILADMIVHYNCLLYTSDAADE